MSGVAAGRSWIWNVLVIAVFVGSGHPAAAQDADTQARAHFGLGSEYYEAGDFERAAREFWAAYELSNRPQLLYNVYVARLDAGNLSQALTALQMYLELAPDVRNRLELEAQERELAAGVESMRISEAQREATAAGNPPPRPEAPVSGPGDTPPPVPVDRGAGSSTVPWLMVAGGGALVLAGAVTGLLAIGAESDLENLCPHDRCPAGFEDKQQEGGTLAAVTDVLWVTGVVAAGVGVVLLVAGEDDGGPDLRAGCDGSGCYASFAASL
jgi:hypothetical protein